MSVGAMEASMVDLMEELGELNAELSVVQSEMLQQPKSPKSARAQLRARAEELDALVAEKQASLLARREALAAQAAYIQGGMRGHGARRMMVLDGSASYIQGMVRGREARQAAEGMDAAALRVQASMVGHSTRRSVAAMESPPAVVVVELEELNEELLEVQLQLLEQEKGSEAWGELKARMEELNAVMAQKQGQLRAEKEAAEMVRAGIRGRAVRLDVLAREEAAVRIQGGMLGRGGPKTQYWDPL